MGFNKLSGGTANPPRVAIALNAGEYFPLPTGQGGVGQYGAVYPPQLASGNPFSGQYMVNLGLYSVLQVYDQGLNYWWNVCSGGPWAQQLTVSADGYSYRIANTTGCPIGALITALGTGGIDGFYGYTNFGPGFGTAISMTKNQTTPGNTIFTITPSAGGSLWNAIVGGSVNTTISFSGTVFTNQAYGASGSSMTASAGSNYTKPPLIVFFPPNNQGQQPYILPTAYAAITAGAISAVTVTNQGAGLVGLPGIAVIPQLGDTTGGGAVLGWLVGNSADPNTTKCTAMWPSHYGAAQTAAITFTFGGTSNPAPTVTAIMNFTITGFGGTPGVGYGTTPGGVFNGGIVAGTSAITNPILDKTLSAPLWPPINVTTGTGVPVLAGPFQGCNIQAATVTYTAIPNGTAAPSTANANTVTLGGAPDVIGLSSF